jgi:hypothetical protein
MMLEGRRAMNGGLGRKQSQRPLPGHNRTWRLGITFVHVTGDFELLSTHPNRQST